MLFKQNLTQFHYRTSRLLTALDMKTMKAITLTSDVPLVELVTLGFTLRTMGLWPKKTILSVENNKDANTIRAKLRPSLTLIFMRTLEEKMAELLLKKLLLLSMMVHSPYKLMEIVTHFGSMMVEFSELLIAKQKVLTIKVIFQTITSL